jgi:hypothetical protein
MLSLLAVRAHAHAPAQLAPEPFATMLAQRAAATLCTPALPAAVMAQSASAAVLAHVLFAAVRADTAPAAILAAVLSSSVFADIPPLDDRIHPVGRRRVEWHFQAYCQER